MSVVIIGKFQGDTGKFRRALAERADEFAQMGEAGHAAGGIHHRFGIGDGFVVVVDEWESVEHFQKFFANPDLQAFIGSVGAAPRPAGDDHRRGRRLAGPVLAGPAGRHAAGARSRQRGSGGPPFGRPRRACSRLT